MKKRYLLALAMLTVLMILRVVVYSQAKVTNGDARYHLQGYSREKGEWTNGILKGWLEENWVPYRLKMAAVKSGPFEITIQHDHNWTGSGGPDPGIDECRSTPGDPMYGDPLFWDYPTADHFWVGDENGNFLFNVSTSRASDLVEPNTIVIQYTSTFEVPPGYQGQTIYLYWMAHLAIGSSEWSGASLHAHTTATGKQDVPIAIPSSNVIYGYKFNDEDADGTWDNVEDGIGNWTIYLEGSYLGENITRDVQTNASGCYEFRGLPDGTWNITEEVRTGEGWIPTTPSTYTVTVRRGQTKGPYNFGNLLMQPDIDVVKSGPAMAHEGDDIIYSYIVTNTGNCPLSDVSLVDDKAGTVVTGETLAVGESKPFTKTYEIPPGAPDSLNNTVTAEGYDGLGRPVFAQDSWLVDILHPIIAIEKTGPVMAHVDGSITYQYVVTNIGDCELSSVMVTDDIAGLATYMSGDIDVDGKLDLLETWVFEASYTVLGSDPDPLVNNATASGTDALGLTVYAEDSWTVDILHPQINIVKSGPEFAHELDNITYTYTVKNLGDCALSGVTVVDDVAGPATYVSGDTDGDNKLDLGETWIFEVNYTIPVGGNDPLENNATDSGTDPLGLTVSAEDSWLVDILKPDIDIVKTAIPDTINSGDLVTYEYNVTNIGDCILYNVEVTDDQLGPIGTIPTLDVDQTTTLTKSTRLFADTANNGTATGTDELGKEVSDWDDAYVHVIIPPEHPPSFAFECPCIPMDWVGVGQIKTITFTVTNVGDPESRVYYLTLTAVIQHYSILQFVDPYTAYIKIYYNNGTVWDAYVDGDLTYEKFAGFSSTGNYSMVTWRVPTTYPDGPYLEGNDGGTLAARLEISFQVEGMAAGTTSVQMFPRATEDHHTNGVQLADIADKANIWGNDLWYPVHNSYDPYDSIIGTGHSWEAGWEPLPTTDQYAQATISVFVWGLLPLTTTTATTETKEY